MGMNLVAKLRGLGSNWKAGVLAGFLSMMVLISPAFGQERSGNIAGTVTDPTGAVIPDVQVTATNLASGRVLSTTSGPDGSYRVLQVEPGRYSLTFEKSGFAKYEVADTIVLVGRTLRADAALSVGSLTQTVEVTEAPPLIDTESTMVAHNVTAEEFDRLPKPRSFDGVAIFSASVNTGEVESGYQINGASAAENNYYIDGVSTSSIINGSLRQSAQFEHLAEVQVKTAGLEAEYGGALGGVVSGITKSGGSKWHGNVLWYYYGNGLNAAPTRRMQIDPPTQATLSPVWSYIQDSKSVSNTHEVGGALGGPIVKDKLFFFTSIDPRWQRRTINYHFSDGDGSMSRKAHGMSWFNKIDLNPSNRVRTSFTWYYTPSYQTGSLYNYSDYCQDCSQNTIADAASIADYGYLQPEQSMSGTINVTLSPTSVLSIRGGRYYLNYKEVGTYPPTEWWWQGSSVGLPGLDPLLQHDPVYKTPGAGKVNHDLTTRTYLQADVSKYLRLGGQHDLKFGIGTTKNVNNVFDDFFGINGRVQLYVGYPEYAGLPTGQYGFYVVNEGGTIGSAGANITHLYVQDAWRIHPRLTLNLGLRTEKETIPSFARSVKEYAFKFSMADKLAPRIGASFDLFGNGKVKLSGFWGRFFDWTKFDLARGTFGADDWKKHYRTLDDLNWWSLGLDNLPGTNLWEACCGGTYRDYRLPGFDYLDTDIKPMSTELLNFGLEAEVMPQTVLSARYVHNKLRRTIEDMGVIDAQGNEQYRYGNPGEGANTFEPVSGASCPFTQGGTCVVPMPKATRQYDAFEVQLTRRFSQGLLFNASYVYSRLYGNYSGLQSTDEIRPPTMGSGFSTNQLFAATNSRPGGNANRYFDLDQAFYDAHGVNGLYGRLPTDRPSVFKFYGAYDFKFGTQVGMFFRASSGTPVTTQVVSDAPIPVYVNGRGDLGRTPTWSQTDLMIAHEIKFGEVKKLRFELNMSNLFNQKTSLFTYDRYNYEEFYDAVGVDLSGTDLTQGFAWQSMAQNTSFNQGIGLDPRYGSAAVFNPGFAGRLGIRFVF